MGDAADDMFDRAMLEEFEEYIDEDGEATMTDNDNKDPQITARYVIDCDYGFSWLFVAGQPENIIVKVNQSEVSHQNLNLIKDAINKDIQQLSSELKQLRAEREGLLEDAYIEGFNTACRLFDNDADSTDAYRAEHCHIYLKSKLTDSAQCIADTHQTKGE